MYLNKLKLLDKPLYDREKVIILKTTEDDVEGMLMNYSLSDDGSYEYVLNAFIESVMKYLPEYSLGYNTLKILQN